MGIVALIILVLVIIGLVVWFLIKNKKPPVELDVPEEPDVPEPPKPDEPDKEPDKPDTPEEPDKPDEPDKPSDETDAKKKQLREDTFTAFARVVPVMQSPVTINYLSGVFEECYHQYFNDGTLFCLPTLVHPHLFPNLYGTKVYGDKGDEDSAFKSLVGWAFALVLSELIPVKRTQLLKVGYELGGYDRYSNIYGYQFRYDPNVMRIVGASLYAALRGFIKPGVDKMRDELGSTKYDRTLEELRDDAREQVGETDFFVDFREFMPTAPGPYAPNYRDRPDATYPNEEKDEYRNLKVDREIHEQVVEDYNLDSDLHYQETVQAIADKEAESEHVFGEDKVAGEFKFHPVFGLYNIGMTVNPKGKTAYLVDQCIRASSTARGIMQSDKVNPVQYGRLRPGCSWQREATKNSKTDDRRNILTNFTIEDGDGNPTGYYDKNGNWVYPNACNSPEQYEEQQKNALWANSYPSGHSSGMFGGAMVLMEMMPSKVDVILKEANQFAINRTIARYHWTSDTINGRVLGSAQNAVSHAASNFDELLKQAENE